jgi:AcrR family transcriptional regulator
MQRKDKEIRGALLERCLSGFIEAGSIDVSLDHLADAAETSKRMLIHYFGDRESLEEQAMTLLEGRLREKFVPSNFPPGAGAEEILQALWSLSTAPESRGVLLLTMDLSRRAWNGSARARAFYEEQQQLWEELLQRYLPDEDVVRDILQSFQGAVLAYLVTGDAGQGRRMINRLCRQSRASKH